MKTDGMFGSILVGASAGGAGIIDGWERGEPFAMLKYGVGYTALGAPLGFLTFAFPFVSTAVMFAGGVGYAIHKNNAEHNNQDLVRR
jgi:hypothetical protein